MKNVLVTGATGFVGRHLCESLAAVGYAVVGTTRSRVANVASLNCELRTIADVGGEVDWGPILADVDYVVHLAARVHVMREVEEDPLTSFRRVNVMGTEKLLRHKGMRGVRRFVYLSSVKVHGEETTDAPFSASDRPMPVDPYGQSKLEAEQLVEDVGAELGIETVIIRPPLVYGPGVSGNFVRLLSLVKKGVPLPFGRVENTRSLVGVHNLCDLLRVCLTNADAAGKRFLISDKEDVSTPELIRLIARSMSRSARLIPVPVPMLRLAAKMLGRSAEVSRLIGSLQVDIEETMQTLNWKPPVTLADGIQSTVTWYEEQEADV